MVASNKISNKKHQQHRHHHDNNNNNKNLNHQSSSTTITSTRVCIKNLPPSFTSAQLRDFLLKEYAARTTIPITATATVGQEEDNNKGAEERLIITDCRVLTHKTNGKSRRVAFCGFQTTRMAANVVQRFHKTFCRTSKLQVEPAATKLLGSSSSDKEKDHATNSAAVSASAPSKVEQQTAQKTTTTTTTTTTTSSRSSSSSEALLNMKSSKAKFWSNDFVVPENNGQQKVLAPESTKDHDENTSNNERHHHDDDDHDDDHDDDDNSSSHDDGDSDSSDDDADPLANKTINNERVVSDLDFLKSKQSNLEELGHDEDGSDSNSSDSDSHDVNKTGQQEDKDGNSTAAGDNDDDDDDDDDSQPMKISKEISNETSQEPSKALQDNGMANNVQHQQQQQQEEEDMPESIIVTSERLFVQNLPFTTTEQELEELFSTFGSVVECHIPFDDRKNSKGFAFVTYDSSQAATVALEALDGSDFQGRFLHLLPSKQKPQDDRVDIHQQQQRPLSFKERQEMERRQAATKSSEGWSASFVRGDAVVDSLADRLGLKKGDILNVKEGLSSGDAAVRLALGETQVIEENRAYFKKHGIDMEALVSAQSLQGDKEGTEKTVKRSNTSILVKNLPYDTLVEELAKMFHGVGDAPRRILLPPSRTIALVEYGHSSDAKRAFRKLAYRRFKTVPLYLEWAPLEAIGIAVTDTDEDPAAERPASSKQIVAAEREEEEPLLEGPTASIYIKNLNFSTTEEKLQQLFEKQIGNVRAVRIPKKIVPVKKPRIDIDDSSDDKEVIQTLSMGFGFVEFSSQESAKKALITLQGTFFDGHALELKPSTKSLTSTTTTTTSKIRSSSKKNPTKVMVRNVPFQATRTELLKLFGSFGQLKRVRLPKKFDGGHRGFAFVEFVTHKEALEGMKALSRTHLYGRHLVLEWAEDETEDPDTGLEALRNKAQRDVLHHDSGASGRGKRQRLS